MKKHLTFILLMVLATITCKAQNERRLALVIGNAEYLGKGNSLRNPVNDANDVSTKLKTLGFDVTTLRNGSKLEMKDAIHQFSVKAKNSDVALFYYSGHGLQSEGQNYMMPVDAEPDSPADIEYSCYPLNQLLDKLDESNCPMKIVVLDACRNNPFTRGWYRSSAEDGLASVNPPRGTFITFATAAGSKALDGTGRNSPYTNAFLETLDVPNLTLFDFFNTVGQQVLEETNNRQDPWTNHSTMKGDFCFNRNKESNKPKSKKESTLTFNVNGVNFNMKLVEGGTFLMGTQKDDPNGDNYDEMSVPQENPPHMVSLDDYYIGETEVTQALWNAVMESSFQKNYDWDSTWGIGDNYPAYSIPWEDCYWFINKLNKITGRNFRLPTEAEWDYAARGGNKSKGYAYAGSNSIDDVAWYDGKTTNYDYGLRPVKTLLPNELGLFDMSGNVWEWCSDWYDSYSDKAQINPAGPVGGSRHICRGGSFNTHAWYCRTANRLINLPAFSSFETGFRLVLSE
jgi:formylglycine-generating enzyme required for sulfatase activity